MAVQPLEPSPLDISLMCDARRSSTRLIGVRWLAGVAVLLTAAFGVRALGTALPEGGLYLTGAAILLYNASLAWLAQRAETFDPVLCLRRIRRLVVLQIALDWLSLTAVLHLTGGITSPAIVFLVVNVLGVAILLAGWLPYAYTGLAVGALGLVAALEAGGVIPHYATVPFLEPRAYTDPAFIGGQLLLVTAAALGIVYLTSDSVALLHEREKRIALLLRVTEDVSSMLEPGALLQRLVHSITKALGVRGASIRLLDETGEELVLRAACGLSQAYLGKGPVDLTRSVMDSDVMAGRPVIIPDATRDSRIQYPRQVAEEGIRSMLAAPVRGRGKPLGVVHVYADRPRHFARPDADYVMAIARQGATALEDVAAYENLQKADRARAQFVQMVTHELRAPVAGAQSLLRTLLRGLTGDLSPEQRDLLGRVNGRLDLLMELINDLLALAASKTVDLDAPLKRLPLQPALKQVIDRLAPEAEAKQVTLEHDIPFEVLSVRATEEGLERVFTNLIGNAIKYTPPGGRVCVAVVERPNGAVVSISDTGIGIPKEDLPRLWTDFFRARNARQSGIMGTGLGLSIVKQLVEHFGGLISVSSVEGQGTTFKLTLPLAGPADEAA